MKKKLIQATCLFFVMMLIFTILSRVSDSVNVIQIQTKNPANQMITHEVEKWRAVRKWRCLYWKICKWSR